MTQPETCHRCQSYEDLCTQHTVALIDKNHYEVALKHIKKHIEISMKGEYRMCTTWNIVNKALGGE